MNNDMSEIPCKQCPVSCICMTKYDIMFPHHSANKLIDHCVLLENWLNEDSQNFRKSYSRGISTIWSYFKSLKRENKNV